ncbi:MAG: aminopeptidase P N-terminal domain-containing protein [Lunatimonas sp.]|uniref:aminopeptidase P N-terminal domain-containing protein n=1 Tax=Lunatimonas sp. TaxID=2060141 RepID=UPI00263A9DDE|nr:aminopeptidase P N-terminal domain-containing protein [Lunatimonas sp.]MCC5936474.1 aminopeptidase P N-terminal domain-containing protein [Lunatimonas sp.]
MFKSTLFLSVLLLLSVNELQAQLTFEKEEYATRREKLMDRIPDGIAIIRGASEPLGDVAFTQYNNMMYFAGVEIPDAILIVDGERRKSTLFFTITEEHADGENISLDLVRDPVKITGIEHYLPYEDFSETLTNRLTGSTVIYTPFSPEEYIGENSMEKFNKFKRSVTDNEWDGRLTREMQFVAVLNQRFPENKVENCTPFIWELRKIKSKAEIDIIRQAAQLSVAAHKAVMKATRPGVPELELAALFQQVTMSGGAKGLAFGTIIMSDKNHAYGHYMQYDRILGEKDFIILDGGANISNYASDVSTTFPANGKFTETQREIYEMGMFVRQICQSMYRPGVSLTEIGNAVKAELEKMGLDTADPKYRLWIRDGGYNHSIGMAVHDRMLNFDRGEPLQAGFVFACDIMGKADDVTGIRIEDTVVITEDGCEILSVGLPRTIDEIEAFMKNN